MKNLTVNYSKSALNSKNQFYDKFFDFVESDLSDCIIEVSYEIHLTDIETWIEKTGYNFTCQIVMNVIKGNPTYSLVGKYEESDEACNVPNCLNC